MDMVFTTEMNRWKPYVIHFTEDYYKYVYFKICQIVNVDEFHLLSSKLNYVSPRLNLYENIFKNNCKLQYSKIFVQHLNIY